MKKIISLFLSVFIAIGNGFVVTAEESQTNESEKLIVNGDFEGEDNYTSLDWVFEATGVWYKSSSVLYETDEALNHYMQLPYSTGLGQTVTSSANTSYQISFKAKFSTDGKVHIQDGDADYPGTTSSAVTLDEIPVTASDEWTEYAYTYTTDNSQNQLFIYVWNSSEDSIWCIDDVSVTCLGTPEPTETPVINIDPQKPHINLLANGDFEDLRYTDTSSSWNFTSLKQWYLYGSGMINDEGNHYVKVSGGVGQRIDVIPGTTYLISARFKTTSETKLRIQDGDVSFPGNTSNTVASVTVPQCDDWTEVSLIYTAPSGQNQIIVYVWGGDEGIYVDDISMVVGITDAPATVNVSYIDENSNILLEKELYGFVEGMSYEEEDIEFKEINDSIYTYKSGATQISSLEADNTLSITYAKVSEYSVKTQKVSTPHHIYPELPSKVTVRADGKSVIAAVKWDFIPLDNYAQTGSFTVRGMVCNCISVSAEVTVTENLNYVDGRDSTTDFVTTEINKVLGEVAEITFEILPKSGNLEGYIGFIAEDAVAGWDVDGIAFQLYTDGRFYYMNGDNGYTKSNAFYNEGKAAVVKIIADFNTQTYSAYKSQKGSEYGIVICENAPFRGNVDNISKFYATSTAAGDYEIGVADISPAQELSIIRTYKDADGKKNIVLRANRDGESTLYFVSYEEDGRLKDIEVKDTKYSAGELVTLTFEDGDDKKLMAWDGLEPITDVKALDSNNSPSFVSSFMGSFAFWDNQYNDWIIDEDPGIVQVNVIEIYSDRISITTRNYGEYSGTEKEPTPFVVKRQNGDNSKTDTPIQRVLVFGDYQIGNDLWTTAEDPIRPIFRKMCEEIKASGEAFDAVMIGGDFSHANYITKERWDFVVPTVLNYIKDSITQNIYIITGNHDYYAGERDNFNSGDYYNAYMKENMGALEGTGNGYFESYSYYEGEYLIGFCYEQNGIYYMGINTSPDIVRGNQQNSAFYFSDGAIAWLKNKLEELGSDKTVLLTGHFPLLNSNNVARNVGRAFVNSDEMVNILKDYPNLIYLYGHDHGSPFAYIDCDTAERVTCYDSEGYKMR